MKTITSWSDLKEYGIGLYRTGEADGLGMRLFLDCDPKGHALLSDFFGNTLTREAERSVWPRLLDQLFKAGVTTMPQAIAKLLGHMCGNNKEIAWELIRARMGGTVNGPDALNSNHDQRAGLWCSVMLPRDLWVEIAAYALLAVDKVDVVVIVPKDHNDNYGNETRVSGCTREEFEAWRDTFETREERWFPFQTYERSTQPGDGLRNAHMWTGITRH